MFSHRSAHHLIPSPELPSKSNNLISGNLLTPCQSPITDGASQTIMPAMLINRASAVSHHIPDALQQAPSQAYAGPQCSYTWPRSEHPATSGHTSFDCRAEPASSAILSRASFGNTVDQVRAEDKWSMVSHQQLQAPFSATSSSFNNHPLEIDQGLVNTAPFGSALRSPLLPASAHMSQLSPWIDSTTAGSFEVTGAGPRYNPPQSYAYDSTPSFCSSLYATSSEMRTQTQPRLHRHLHRTERFDPPDSDGEGEKKQGEPPYAKLIYRALMDAPDHQMVLKDIYGWIAQNTDKAKDPAFKGWQNSVRHNLSMNGAFRKVPHSDPLNKARKGFIWLLEPSAVGVGIESTTRYRQKTVSRRGENDDQADPKRQRSGRKGGKTARKSAKMGMRRSALLEHDAGYIPYPKIELGTPSNGLPDDPIQQTTPHENSDSTSRLPYYLTPPLSSTPPSFPDDYLFEFKATIETPQKQQHVAVFDQRDQPLFNHPIESGC